MRPFHDLLELSEVLRSDWFLLTEQIVSIDGWTGAGKGKVGSFLDRDLSTPVIHMDDYFQDEGSLLYSFWSDDLLERIHNIIKKSSLQVEGILIQDILSRLNLKSYRGIYVRRVSLLGLWFDGYRLQQTPSRALHNSYVNSNYDVLHNKIIEYHKRTNLYEIVDYVLELVETNRPM